jgi:hypothetical protein
MSTNIDFKLMENNGQLRHQIIENLLPQQADNAVDIAITQWELMATQIVLIIGEGGFSALYLRSLHLAQATFPWLPSTSNSLSLQGDARFEHLKTSLEGQSPELVSAANHLLLVTLTDILASLLGEALTIRILNSAWSNPAPTQTGVQT